MLVLLLLLGFPSFLDAREPSIQEVQEQTVHYLGFNHEEMDQWKSRSRWAAVLPRLQAGFDRELKDVVTLSTQDSVSISGGEITIGPDENDFDQNFNQGTSFDVKAVWFLNELIFNRDSLAASSERRDWIRERTRALEEVTEAYFARKRLRDDLRKKKDPLEIREQKTLLLDRAAATIDARTGGWFSREMER